MGELVKHQFKVTRRLLEQTLEGVTSELAAVIPEGFNNNIHWQVGHILKTAEFFLFFGEETLPENYQHFFGPGTKPAEWSEDVPSIETLKQQLKEQLERIEQLNVEKFTDKLPKPMIGNETFGEFAAFGAFHESLHLGQIQTMKRLLQASQVNQ